VAGSQNDKHFQYEEQVSMIAFGPSCGLSTHKLAVASGAKIYVYQIATTTTNGGGGENANAGGGTSSIPAISADNGPSGGQQTPADLQQQTAPDFVVKSVDVLEEGSSQVVRISWNVLGDVLSAVHADGIVRIWSCKRLSHSNCL
jgi:hypothetical protein